MVEKKINNNNKLFDTGSLRAFFLMFLILIGLNSGLMAADDEIFVPFVDLAETWIKGNLGYFIALLVVAFGVIGGAITGSIGMVGKGIVFGIGIGAIVFLTENAHNLGLGLGA